MKILFAMVLAFAAAGAPAQAADPLKSAACAEALATLDATRAADARSARLPGMREQAAQSCLGGGSAPGRSARMLQAPVAVPPPVVTPPPVPGPPALPRLPAPAVEIARPAMPAHCDAGGCWAEDGGRLRHVGPNLGGPNGLCMQHGAQLACP